MGYIRVDLPNTNNKWIGFGLANVDMFIIHVGFGLTNVDTIRILTRYEHDPSTRIATPNHVELQFLFYNPNLTAVEQNLLLKSILIVSSLN